MLTIISGTMFGGKTSTLLAMYREEPERALLVNHRIDTRYNKEDSVVTHDGDCESALKATRLEEVFDRMEYRVSKVIFVDEAQFFDDLEETVHRIIETDGKRVVLAGLMLDCQRRPFGKLARLVPHANAFIVKRASCHHCGAQAMYNALRSMERTPEVGGAELYVPVCRSHHPNSI